MLSSFAREIQKNILISETSDILRTSYKSFSIKFLEVRNFLVNYLAKEVKQNFTKQSFLVNKRKILNRISETKPNTNHLK